MLFEFLADNEKMLNMVIKTSVKNVQNSDKVCLDYL